MRCGARPVAAAWLVAALGAAGVAVAAAPAPLPPETYRLRQADPSTGTNIPRTHITGSDIPLNRRYEQLTDDQKRIVKQQYEPMADADEPPFPIDGLGPLMRAAQQVVQTTQEQGELSLLAHIDATGAATSVDVLRAGDPLLARRVAAVLMLTRYKPAVCGGRPCAMGFPLRLNARLER